MKSLIYLCLFLTLFNKRVIAKYIELDVSSKVINFSSYCTPGNISIFIISEHGCVPCLRCKDFLLGKHYDMDVVDIYYCLITKNLDDLAHHKYENRESNKMWSYIEGCTSPPYIYIFGPAGNPTSIIESFSPDKISKNIDVLLETISYFRINSVDYKNNGNSGKSKLSSEPSSQSAKIKLSKSRNIDEGASTKKEDDIRIGLENDNTDLKNKIQLLQNTVGTLNNQVDQLLKSKDVLSVENETVNRIIDSLTLFIEKNKAMVAHQMIQIANNIIIVVDSIRDKDFSLKKIKQFLLLQAIDYLNQSNYYEKDENLEFKLAQIRKRYKKYLN